MDNLSYFSIFWISFILLSISSFGVFFFSSFDKMVSFSSIALTAISLIVLNTDIFRSNNYGTIIILTFWSLFCFQVLFLKWALQTKIKKNPVFLFLPFMSFITIACSLDLILLLIGLTTFGLSFVVLSALREIKKTSLFPSVQQLLVSFLCFCYGISCLYAREGSIQLKDIYLKLRITKWDGLTTLSFILLFLAVLIEVYAILPLLKKKK